MKKVGDSWDFLGRGESPIPPTMNFHRTIGENGQIFRGQKIKNANAKLIL